MPPKLENHAPDASDETGPYMERLDTARLLVLCATIIAASVAWSFHMVSFLHAKETVLCATLLVQGILYALRRPPAHAVAPPLTLAVLGLWLVCITYFAGHQSLLALAGTQRFFLIVLSGLVVCDLVPRHGRAICASLVFSGGMVALLACLQYAGWVPFLFPVFPGYDQAAYSAFGNQDLLGSYLAITLALGAAMACRTAAPGCQAPADAQERQARAPVPHFSGGLAWPIRFCLPVIATGLYISISRSAWLAAAVGIAVAVPWRTAWGALPNQPAAAHGGARHPCRAGMHDSRRVAGTHAGRARNADLQQRRRGFPRAPVDVGRRRGNGQRESVYRRGVLQLCAAKSLLPGQGALWAPGGKQFYHNELHADTAHSEPLQFAAENGIIGIALLAGVFLLVGSRPKKGNLPLVPVCRPLPEAWGALAALGVAALLNATLHSAPHALAGLLLLCGRPGPCRPFRLGRAASWAAPAICLLFLWPHVQNTLIPSYLLRVAETAHVKRQPDAEALYRKAIAWGGFSTQAHEDYAILLSDQGRHDEALRELDLANPGLDTGRVHLLRAACAQSLDRKDLAFKAASQCLYRWPENAQAWDILMKNCPPGELDAWKQRWARWMGKAATSSVKEN